MEFPLRERKYLLRVHFIMNVSAGIFLTVCLAQIAAFVLTHYHLVIRQRTYNAVWTVSVFNNDSGNKRYSLLLASFNV